MNTAEFELQVWPVFSKLWPASARKSNDEHVEAFVRASGRCTADEVVWALRSMLDDGVKWPEPNQLRKKLAGRYSANVGKPVRENYTQQREREEWERLQHSIREVIDNMSDDDLDAHALMYAASHPHLHWTANMHPRVNVGVRAAIHYRVRAGLGPYDKQGVFKQADGRPGFVAITDEAIDHVRERIRVHGRSQKREGVVIR